MRVRGHALGGNAIARGLEMDPSGDVHALQACGIDAASHLEAQCTRRWTVFSLPQEPQRCIIAVIATLMNDALIWKVEKDGKEREEESSVPLGGHLRLKGCPVHLTYF